MTKDELRELIRDCPTLFHMAECGSWESIKKNGLLSTAALLDLYEICGSKRHAIEQQRRQKSVQLERAGFAVATIRDQLPMDDKGLSRCLTDNLSPADWYKLLNSKVFFWLTRERLLRLLSAGTYRDQEHDVLEFDTMSLVQAHKKAIWLCPMNSGCTKPFPHPRGKGTFLRIDDYPYASWKTKRRRGERVVELAADYAVPNAAEYVVRVNRMKRSEIISNLFER